VTLLDFILVFAAAVVGIGLLSILVWLGSTAYMGRVERAMARRKGPFRQFVEELSTRDREYLEPEYTRLRALRDFEALEAVLEEQARNATERPAWLLDAYDRLGLVDKYIARLATATEWRERAFAAELLGRVGNAKAVPGLLDTVQATRNEDADVREIALRALARIADPRAVVPLVEALKRAETWLAPRIANILVRHGEHVVDPMMGFLADPTRHPARAWAANILGELKVAQAFPALAKALSDVDDEVRAKAAGALGRLGDRRAVSYLLDHLLTDPAPFVRARIAGALGQFDDPEVIDRLVRALGDPAWWVRLRSVEALEQIGANAERPLQVALDDPDPEIRIRAAVALERMGVPARLMATIEGATDTPETHQLLVKFGVAGARELLAEHLSHPAAPVRMAMIRAIRQAERRDIADELIERGGVDPDADVRCAAFETLHALALREAVPAALSALGDGDQRVRAAATLLLGDLGGSELGDMIRPRATDAEPLVRAAAARALGLVRATRAEPDFSRLLGDPVPAVRAAAAEGVAEAGWRGAVPQLVALLGDSDSDVQAAAARALGVLGDPASAPALLAAFRRAEPGLGQVIMTAVAQVDRGRLSEIVDVLLERDDGASRLAVAQTIGTLKPPLPVELLEMLLRDQVPEVRAAVAEVLVRVEGDRAAGLLRFALADPEDLVRARAIDSLVRLDRREAAPAVLDRLANDPSALVRERAALAVGLFRVPGGEVELLKVCHTGQAIEVRAAACLAIGAYDQESMIARVLEMADESDLRERLRERLRTDSEYRLLGLRLRDARHVELRALSSTSREEMEKVLADGMRGVLSPAERIRLVAGLRAFQGDRSRGALLQVIRSDPDPEVRATALVAVGGMLDAPELALVASRALSDPHPSVRRAAVGLFQRVAPEQALASLIRLLRADEDPVILKAVAQQAEAVFPAFLDLTLGVDLSGGEAVLVTRMARHMHHHDLPRVLAIIGRSTAAPVREAVADLWAARPDLTDEAVLEGMTVDPSVAVRRAAVSAWVALGRFERLATMLGDPDPRVRADIALGFRRAPDIRWIEPLARDVDETVRAAHFVTRVLRGEATEPPDTPPLARAAAAAAMARAVPLEELRQAARTDRDQAMRGAAAVALAVLDDEVAHAVARTDPVPVIRERVGRMLAGWREPPPGSRRQA
jgi:HEAT repeat protein